VPRSSSLTAEPGAGLDEGRGSPQAPQTLSELIASEVPRIIGCSRHPPDPGMADLPAVRSLPLNQLPDSTTAGGNYLLQGPTKVGASEREPKGNCRTAVSLWSV